MIYQISRDEESSGECSQCQRQQQEGVSHHHLHEDTSEEGEEGEDVESHSRPIQPQKSILMLLQEEINQLKRSNQDKDKAIRELRYELETISKNQIDSLIAHKTGSIKKIEKETIMSPKAIMNRVYSPEMRPKPRGFLQTDSALQIALLEKQVKELQLKVLQLTNKLGEYEQSFNWMQKFIISFVQMAEDLSLTYGGKMNTKGLPLRKKTKMSWKYIKELINYLIK